MKLVITIPSYNEEHSLASVIAEIPRDIPGIDHVQILVINDGSTDRTVDIATQAGADKILSHKHNMGLAKTFRDGLDAALEMSTDIIINIDTILQIHRSGGSKSNYSILIRSE